MVPHAPKDSGGESRRKSMNLFSRAMPSTLPQINTEVANIQGEDEGGKKGKKKLSKRTSMFGIGPTASPDLQHDGMMSPAHSGTGSPKTRHRTLQKGRPTSIFGSLGKKSLSHHAEEGEDLTGTTPESPMEDSRQHLESSSVPAHGKTVLLHGEVQTTVGMFRKKKEYLVLTDTHLIRFKSQSRASETFHSISPFGRGATRHPSTNSIGSLQEVQSNNSHTSGEGESRIPLGQIVTAYKVEDGRPFFTTEVVYLDEEYHGAGSIQLMLHDPKDADLWHTSIRAAAQKARLMMAEPYPERVVRFLVQILESLDDYDPNHFQVFRVVRRAANQRGGKSSSDDLQKLGSSLFYMVIGLTRMHMIPVPDFSGPSGRLVASKMSRSVFGLVTLNSINCKYEDDRFEVGFRTPMVATKLLELAASATTDIAVVLIRAGQYLKPQWLDYNFSFNGPRRLLETADVPVAAEEEEYGCFDRTLVAYCMAYNCNPTNIQYAIDWEVEDAPEFKLFPPANTVKYSMSELLAIMRALRYNESFHSISFKDIDMHVLHGLHDIYGQEHIAWQNRSGASINRLIAMRPQDKSLLYQEVQALALKSSVLRRMDFTNVLPRRRPRDTFDVEGLEIEKDPGCEIVSGLLPLCRSQLTEVTWIVLSGIELGETDLDDMIPALHEPKALLRAVECSRCGLSDRGIMQVLNHLGRQNATMECIDISDNPGRIQLEQFTQSISLFSKIRKLDLSRITRTSGEHPLIETKVILSWKLEELIMNGVPLNEKTLDTIAAYLSSNMSDSLRVVKMDQCNLTGSHVALLMRSMTRVPGEGRNIELHVSANRLEKGVGEIVRAVEENHTPTLLVMRMIEFTKEDHFKQLLQALRTNTTIRSLDISKASLPYDAGPETCDALQQLFVENETLEDLDISGEHAHLEVTRFGIGLSQALNGLKHNKALKVLRIEWQNLGLEGANTLSSVIEGNSTLTHIYCEHNDINLQGFTILVNALANNYTILDLPLLMNDQGDSMKRIHDNLKDTRRAQAKENNDHGNKISIRRKLTTLGASKPQKQDLTPQDLDAVVRVLNERWRTETQRLAIFLDRNRGIAAGLECYGPEGSVGEEHLRPTTAMSDRGILEQVLSNTTPKVELGNPVEDHVSKVAGLSISDAELQDEKEKGAESLSSVDEETPKKPRINTIIGEGPPTLPAMTNEKMFELGGGIFEMEQ
ncbi:hypothetical protein D0Z07_5145 [Hyphodiscus hymeniophilus]|uniref:LRR-containing protein second PH domain-containing protein n=1 Tax=Hyphodiscus hymeniophilus TaxID=353542 RepID=A0A9P6VIH6_9HELO|nr:hypothetical protein D0Z07_5145 [Hyphodiscus hymeniophilus]